jgi:NitT/TauT family transport system substrate-binding protein
MKRSQLAASLAACSLGSVLPLARAQATTKIQLGFTAVTEYASALVAVEEGFFKKRGLEVEPKLIPLNSTIPAAVQSDSLQIGGPTPSVFLQAVDGGLDHVVVAGAGATSKSVLVVGLVAKAGSGIRTAQDCIGRRIGVPGLGAFLHVTFRAWLKQSGVDYRKVNFVEASFPQHLDLLRAGAVDGLVSAEPFITRITDSNIGYVASYYSTFLPDGVPTIVYAAKREWVERNAGPARAFREALVEAAAWVNKPANDTRLRQHIGKYIKLPPEVIAKMQINPPAPVVTQKQMDYWVALMKDQEMLRTNIDTARLVFK